MKWRLGGGGGPKKTFRCFSGLGFFVLVGFPSNISMETTSLQPCWWQMYFPEKKNQVDDVEKTEGSKPADATER